MPRNKKELSLSMKKVLGYIQKELKNGKFSAYVLPSEVLHNSYSKTLNALVKRGYLEKDNDNYYRLKQDIGTDR
jgi:DNA-binding IclR family transcriptional regulator